MTEDTLYKAQKIRGDIIGLKLWRSRFSKCNYILINLDNGSVALSDYTDEDCLNYVKEILDKGIAKKIKDLEREFEEL